jgi:hypothetical protein
MALPKVVQMNKAEALVQEWIKNKAEADNITARNREIASILAGLAEYRPNSATGRVPVEGYKVTVTLKNNVKWDQGALQAARIKMGDEQFARVFSYKFEPRGKVLPAFLQTGEADIVRLVRDAMTTTPGQPALKVEGVE